MKVITAPESYVKQPNDLCVFLAGGITNCKDWQKELINIMNDGPEEFTKDLVLFNPRRDNFNIGDKSETVRQIEWEFNMLERCDIFSMYFVESESDQPICMYELGRNICRIQMRFPFDWESRIIITSDKNYKRYNDVYWQTLLATSNKIKLNTDFYYHCQSILHKLNRTRNF